MPSLLANFSTSSWLGAFSNMVCILPKTRYARYVVISSMGDGRRCADNVVIVIGRVCLVHLCDIGTDVADIVVDRKLFAGLLFLAGHEIRDVLSGDVHAVIIGVFQQLAFRICSGNQVT